MIPPLLEWGLRTIYELKSEYPLLVYARFRIDIVVGSEDSIGYYPNVNVICSSAAPASLMNIKTLPSRARRIPGSKYLAEKRSPFS